MVTDDDESFDLREIGVDCGRSPRQEHNREYWEEVNKYRDRYRDRYRERAIADAAHGVRAVRAGADLARLLLRDLEMHQRNEMRAQYERRTPFGKKG